MKDQMNNLFKEFVPDLPKKVQIKLPNIKKIKLPKKPQKVESNG